MNCPKCDHPTEPVVFGDIEVDRCTHCKGIWFDMLEAEHLKDLDKSETIDIGDVVVGKGFNKIDQINCPKCHAPMIRMVDAGQPHIWYEGCGICHGLFFDAGEFADYKEENLMDFIQDTLSKERK
ncbi:MAG: zf-TFIIB domain-containing protein [Phycisphaerae bacterium]|jgi:Zn-finger nucleic acid-binding protein|nr:zf-TFIIB domain-containing protein [Phycisphaerae bacterium]MDP7286914.1 zf-TFIIB domain-containing protein [Phycisphaerae bacterium]